MNNKLAAALLIVFMTVAMYSCKSHERCPAYGKANTENPIKRV
jgi:hypothetical protein